MYSAAGKWVSKTEYISSMNEINKRPQNESFTRLKYLQNLSEIKLSGETVKRTNWTSKG